LTRRIYDADLLKYISLFESLTGAKVHDLINDESLTVIVEKGNMGLALGKHRKNLLRVENVFKKKIKVVEFDDDVKKFIRNFVYPLRMMEISQDGKNIIIKGNDTKTKGLLIGRERRNLKRLVEVVKRFFDIEDISVV
jgi:NusA-like KH domain protein